MEDADGKLLRHAVFFSFNEESSEQDIESVTTAFAALPEKIDSIIDFQWGTNNSPENHDDGFTHGFLLTFKDEAGRDVYLPHPAHTGEFADKLKPHMKDVFVIDYWGTPHQNEIKKELKHAVFFKFKDDADPAAVQQVEQAFAARHVTVQTKHSNSFERAGERNLDLLRPRPPILLRLRSFSVPAPHPPAS